MKLHIDVIGDRPYTFEADVPGLAEPPAKGDRMHFREPVPGHAVLDAIVWSSIRSNDGKRAYVVCHPTREEG